MEPLLKNLAGGDFRSLGSSSKVVRAVLAGRLPVARVIKALLHKDPLIRMRAADVAEKVSKIHPEWLRPYKKTLLKKALPIHQQEVQWHVAQMIARLPLTSAEKRPVVRALFGWLNDEKESRIVRVMALQALADLAASDSGLRRRVKATVEKLLKTGPPSLKSRGRHILKQLAKQTS